MDLWQLCTTSQTKCYSFRLDVLNCIASLPIRPHPQYSSLHEFKIELYGVPGVFVTIKSEPQQEGGDTFSFSRRGLDAEGEFDMEGMVVKIDSVKYNDIPLCFPGTYTFDVED